MTTTARSRWPGVILLLWLIGFAGVTAWLQVHLTLPGFAPVDYILDLERKSAVPSIKRGFSVMPHQQYLGIIHTRNKDDETVLHVRGLPRHRYLVRFKARFPSTNHQIALYLNDHRLGVAVPKQIEVAQKFKFIASPEAIREDLNVIRCVHSGIRAAVDYEVIEFRNYQFTSESGNLRLFFDGPWIQQAAIRVSPWLELGMVAGWLTGFVGLGFLAFLLLLVGLRVNAGLATNIVVWTHAISVVGQTACYGITLLTPVTLWISTAWFVATTVVAPLLLCLLLTVGSVLRTMALSVWFLLVRSWFALIWVKAPVKKGALGIVALLWYVAVALWRWLWHSVAFRAFLAFVILYVAGGIALWVGWRKGAEWLVDGAFGMLICSLIARGWRIIVTARLTRGVHGA